MAGKKKVEVTGNRKPSKSYGKYVSKLEKTEAKRRIAAESVGTAYTRAPQVSLYLYERRNDILRREGFLWWERYWLAQGTISTPAMVDMRRERKSFFDRVKKGDLLSYNMYAKEIIKHYRDNGWYFSDGTLNPFKMVDDYRQWGKHEDYPSKRRRVIRGDYRAKKEATLAARSRR